ncbi:MAG: hypothetical protein U0176_02560 [Bacteroidia bacterium]
MLALVNAWILIGCGKTTEDSNANGPSDSKSIPSIAIHGVDGKGQVPIHTQFADTNSRFDAIIFGQFCGECVGTCSKMFKFEPKTGRMHADYWDSFWKRHEGNGMNFEMEIRDRSRFLKAQKMVDSIPEYFITTERSGMSFGCPDCTDECGLYLETQVKGISKEFFFDSRIEQIPLELYGFADLLRLAIGA